DLRGCTNTPGPVYERVPEFDAVPSTRRDILRHVCFLVHCEVQGGADSEAASRGYVPFGDMDTRAGQDISYEHLQVVQLSIVMEHLTPVVFELDALKKDGIDRREPDQLSGRYLARRRPHLGTSLTMCEEGNAYGQQEGRTISDRH